MRLHLVALPHVRLNTPTTHLCAYSGKVMKFVKMMRDRHELVLYAPECYPIQGAQSVDCLHDWSRQIIFGKDDPNRMPNWPSDEESAIFNANAIRELQRLYRTGDIVLLVGGMTHLPITRALPDMRFCEPFVGYEGVLLNNIFAAYESHSHMDANYARNGVKDIRWYDCVIPPFVDPDEFPVINAGNGQYLLFVGRLIARKGVNVAHEIAKRAGLPLLVAGAGGRMEGDTLIGQDVRLEGNVKYLGPLNVEERAVVMAGAKALLCPTIYFEPGGNVAIEAQMAGTPVIAPDSGVFAETVKDYFSGFHFRMLRDGVKAVQLLPILDPKAIRDNADANYSLAAIGPRFDKWFDQLATVSGDGWYAD